MKKIVTALVLLAMVLSIFSMTAFAVDQNTLTKAQYEKLKASADFVEEFNHGIRINFMCDMLIYLESKESQYITDKYDDGYASAAEIPANLMKDIFYEATSAPIGFFESDVLPLLNKNDERFYNADKGTYRIFNPAMGGGHYSVLNGYIDNNDSTYSFYYAGYADYGEYEAGELPEDFIVITLKLENDGIALVSDKQVDKLPEKYSEVPTATTAIEAKVVYDTEKGITFADNNNFEAGTTVTAKEVKSGTAFDTAKKALNGVSNKYVVYDFSAVKNGETVQPNGKVKVTMDIPATLFADGLKMFYVSDKGEKEEIKITVDKKNKTITAELEHFSTYVLANVSTSPNTGDNSNTVILAILCLISLAGFSILAVYKISKENC